MTKKTFRRELQELLNKYGQEKYSDTPDFILESYVTASLSLFDTAVNMREHHYGRSKPYPSKELSVTNEL